MQITDEQFEAEVLNSDKPVLVDFWASWCPPCKMMQPMVDRLADAVTGESKIVAVNIDRNPAVAAKYQVNGVPTFLAFARGIEVVRRTGALTENQLRKMLSDAAADMPTITAGPGEPVPAQNAAFVTVVSGLPRSGTSMMMKMLEAGGIPALTDRERTADTDNPNGYYELECVKNTASDSTWVEQAAGKAVKMVYRLLDHLPADREYRVLFMRRHMDEILASQRRMLARNGVDSTIDDLRMKRLFEADLKAFDERLASQKHLKLIDVNYNDLMASPQTVLQTIRSHLGGGLDIAGMMAVLDPSLYRNRAS